MFAIKVLFKIVVSHYITLHLYETCPKLFNNSIVLKSGIYTRNGFAAIKSHVMKYFKTFFYERNGKNLFLSLKNSDEILNKLKSKGFLASCVSTYHFATLYTTLSHNLIKEILTELIEQHFNSEGSLYLACNAKCAFSLLNNIKKCGHIRKFVMLSIVFWTIYL